MGGSKILKIVLAFWAGVATFITGFFIWDNLKPKNENVIPIAMALDDGYLYPTIVSITSMMENAEKDTVYNIYIMHPDEFLQESKEKLCSLGVKYKNCNIKLINMKKEYAGANEAGHITKPAYYRLSLSELLPSLDKIIWMDGDTLIFDDLHQMYNLELNDNYYLAYLDDKRVVPEPLKNFGLRDNEYVCDGVMLVNLRKLREDDMVPKFKGFIERYNDKLIQHDQTVINAVCYGKIGILPPKFGMFNFRRNGRMVYEYVDGLTSKNKYDCREMDDAIDNLVVLHCVNKPWQDAACSFADTWWQYAKKTDFYDEICDKYELF